MGRRRLGRAGVLSEAGLGLRGKQKSKGVLDYVSNLIPTNRPTAQPTNLTRLTEKADVFSFGVVLYELLSRSLLLSWRLAAPAPAVAPAAAAAAPGPPAADRSASRSGRWAAAAAAQLQTRGAGIEAVQMLAYAQRVADGYRPPNPPFWPPQFASLVASCTAQEPHERPRMAEVLEALRALAGDAKVVTKLNAYVHKDIGYVPLWAEGGAEPGAAAAAAAEGEAGAGKGDGEKPWQRSASLDKAARRSTDAGSRSGGGCGGAAAGGGTLGGGVVAAGDGAVQQPCGCVLS